MRDKHNTEDTIPSHSRDLGEEEEGPCAIFNGVMTSGKLDALGKALVTAQKQMKPAAKDGVNPHFKSRFATMENIWEASNDALVANGLSIIQLPTQYMGVPGLNTMLLHSSGQYVTGFFPFPKNVKEDPQGYAAALTYYRRCCRAAITGVIIEDDDGNSAMPHKREETPPLYKVTPKAPVEAIHAKQADFKLQPITKAQQSLVYTLADEAQAVPEDMKALLRDKFGKNELIKLTQGEASSLINDLTEMARAIKPKPGANSGRSNDGFPFES